MSLPGGRGRGMRDRGRARRAKQVRRDARRAKKRVAESSTDTALTHVIRSAFAGGQPLSLLGVASMAINAAKPVPLISLTSGQSDPGRLDRILDGLIGVRERAGTALL